jgi:hypothetical protein
VGSRVLTSLHGCSKPCRFYDRARRQCGPRQPVSVRMALRQSAEEGPLTHACSTHPSGAIQAFSLQGPTEREKVGHDSPTQSHPSAPGVLRRGCAARPMASHADAQQGACVGGRMTACCDGVCECLLACGHRHAPAARVAQMRA